MSPALFLEVNSLGDFAASMTEDLLLCPVRSLSASLDRTSGLVMDLAVCLSRLSAPPGRCLCTVYLICYGK